MAQPHIAACFIWPVPGKPLQLPPPLLPSASPNARTIQLITDNLLNPLGHFGIHRLFSDLPQCMQVINSSDSFPSHSAPDRWKDSMKNNDLIRYLPFMKHEVQWKSRQPPDFWYFLFIHRQTSTDAVTGHALPSLFWSAGKYHDRPSGFENPVWIRITAHIKKFWTRIHSESPLLLSFFSKVWGIIISTYPGTPSWNPFCKAGLPDAEGFHQIRIRKAVSPLHGRVQLFSGLISCASSRPQVNPCILSSDSHGYCPFSRSCLLHSFIILRGALRPYSFSMLHPPR